MREPRSARELYEGLAAPGEVPFRIKGAGYVFHDKWVEQFLPGGRAAQLEALGELGKHPFFQQIFMAGSMYDVFPLVALGYACAAVRGESFAKFVEMRARYQAEQDLQHIRKWLVKLVSPTTVAKRFPSILVSYFDFGEPSNEVLENGMRGSVKRVPALLAPWLIATCRGFALHALEVNGAHQIRIESHALPRGEWVHEQLMVDLRFDFSWSTRPTQPPSKPPSDKPPSSKPPSSKPPSR